VKVTLTLNRGDILEIQTAGGGGYGDPTLRDKTLIQSDLLNGYITPKYAEKHHGYKQK